MNTLEMMKYAKQDDMSYESSFGIYLPDEGFVINEYGKKCFDDDTNLFLHMLLEDDTVWHPQPEQPKKMTLKEIEKELGYKIELTDDEIKDKKTMDFNNFLRYLFY